jgi:hypothetical protein
MLTVYIFCLVLGGGFLLLSLLSGEGGEAEFELDGGLDLEGGLELDAGDMDGAIDVDTDSEVAAGKIFSLRGLIYGAFGFGATGALLTLLDLPQLAVAGSSVAAGFLASALVTSVFNYLRRTESGALPGDRAFVGASGRVVLPLEAERAGAVVVERAGREIRLRALPHATGEGDPAEWRQIMVVEVDRGIARVVPMKEDHLLEP